MATNIEQIFRSFVVNKFKEIQEEQLNSENNESSQNGELMAQATESTSGNNTAMHVESEGCPQSVENVEKMQSEALDLENPHSSALEENSSSKEMKPSEVSSSDEVKKDASRKKSKKHKKHKSKKKKKKKKKEKRSKSISSIEDQENVHLEPKSMWKPAFSSPAKEDAIVDLDSKTELVSETDVAFITPTVSSTQGTILDSVTENQTCTKIQVDGDSEFFGPKCPTEINYTNSIDCSIQEESEGVCDKSKHVTGHTEIVKQMEGHTAETMPHSNLPENDLLQPCLVTTHLKATESNSNKLQRLDQSASSPALCHLPDKTKTGDKLRSKSIEKSIPTASRSRSRSKSIVKEVKQKLNSKSPLLESCTLSTSMTQRRRSRSSSLRPRKRSRSKSYSKGQRSRSSTPARYSKSPIRSWWSKSIRNRQRSRSLSVVGRQRSSTRSPVRRRNSRTGSLRRRHRSKSRSSVRRLTSRSRSQSRRRRSQSKSPAIKRRSRSVSPLRTRRSRPSSRAKRLKSRSKSAVRRRRSRSVSAVRRHKSRSQSVARTQKSRSPSAARRRRLSRSTSAARRRRSSRSSSAARRRRSSRSPSAARRRRSSLSPSAARRRRSSRSPSAARRRRSSRSPSAARRRRSSRSTSAVRRRRSSRSTSAARRRRSSRSTSAARRRRSSRSTSAARRRRSSRSTSAARRRRSSRSTSAARRRRSSRSTSAARRRRSSRSTSAARRRRSSRSTSAARRRRSSRSTSAARRRRSSRSTSAARRRRSSRSTSAARRRRSSSPLRKQLSTSRSGTGRDHSRSRSIMRKQKSRSRSIDKHSSSLEGKSRSHSETKEQCSKSSVKKMETACSPKAKNDNLKLANISPTTLLQTNSPDKENRPCHGMLTEFVNVSSSTVLRPEFTLSPVVATRKELQGAFFHVEAAVLADTPSTLCDTIFPPIGPSSESDAVKDMALDGITDPNSKQSSLKEGEIVCIDLQKEMLMSEIDLQQPCARTSSDTPKHENQANMGISEPTQNTAQPCINSNVLKRDPVKFNPASTYGAGIATSFAENKHSVESECSILSSSSVAEFTFIDTSSKAELKPLHSEQTASLPINTEFSISHLAQDSPQQSPFREQGKPSREEKTELNTDHDLGNSEPLQSELKMNKDGSKSSCKPEMIVHNTSASVNSEGYQTLQTDLIADMEVCQNNKSTEQDSFDSSKPNEQSFFACDAGTSTKPDSSLSQDKFDTGAERRISLSSESDRSILKNKEVFLDHPEANNKTLPENRLIEDSEISIHQKSVITKFVDNTVTESSNYCKATSVEQRPFLSVLPKTRDSNMTHLASPRSSECLHQDHPSDNSVVHFASKPSQPLDHKDLIIPQPLQVPQSHVSQLPKNDSLLALQEYSSKDALRKPEKKLTTEATFHTGQFSPVPVLSSEKNDAPLSSPSGSSDSNICKGTTNDSQLSSKSGVLGPSTVDSTQSDAFENRNLRKQTDPPENISKSTVPTKVQHSTSGDIFPYQGTSKDSCRTFHSSNEKHSLSFDSNKVPGTTVDHTHKSRVQHTKTTKEPLDIIVQDIVAQPSDSDRRHSSVQKQEYDLATVAKTIDSEEGQAAMYDRSGDTTKDYIETNSKLISSKRSIGLSRLPADTFEVKKSAEPKSSKKMNFSFKEHTSNVYQENRSDSSMRNKSSANFEKDSLKTCPQTMHSETQSSFVNQMSTIAGCSSELTTGAKTKACLTTDNETQKSDGNGRQNLGQSIALSNPVNFKFSRTFKPINIAPIQVPSEAIVSSNLESSKIGMLPLRDPLKFASSAVDSTKSGPLQSNLQDVKERKDSCNTTATKSQECGKISDLVVNPHPAADNVLPKVLSDLEPVNASTATTTTPSTVQLHAQVVITSLQPSALKSISAPVERKVSPGSQVSEKSGDSVETSGSDHLQQSNLVTSDSSQSSTAIKHTFPHLSNTTSKTVKQRHYRSRSMTQESRSPSMDRGRTSRSKSPQRKRRSRSKSYVRKSSKSSTRRRRSRSKSGGKRRRSRSKSKGRRKHSPSKLAGRRRHSRSKSAERKRRSKSSDRSKRVRSKSPPVRKRQSRSRSATRKKRSRSKLGRRRVSRSISPVRRRRSRSKSVSTRSRSHSKSASWRHSSGSKSTVRRRHSRSSSKSTSPRRRSLSRRVHSVSKSPVPQRRTRSRSSTRRQSSKSRGRWRRSRSFSTSRRRSRSSSRPRSVSSKKRHSSSKSPNRRPRSQSKTKLKENSPLSRDKSKSSSPPQKKIQSKSTPFKHSIGLKSLIQKQLSQAKLQSSSGKGSSKEQLPLTSLTAKAPLNISNVSTKTQLQNSIRSNKAQSSVTRSQLSMSGLNARTQMPMSNAPSEGQVTLPDLSSETVSPLTMSELTTGTPWSIPNMVVGSQWPVSDLATGSQWTMSEMTAGAHWPVSDLSTGTQWPVSDLTSGSQWAVPDLTGGSQWAVPDLTGGSQWAVPDLTGGSQWAVPDLAAGSQWTVPNLAAGSQWTVSHLATGTHWTMPNIPSASQLPGSCLLTETHVAMPTLVAGSQVAVPALPKETQPAETPSTVSELDTKDQIAVSETPLIVNEPEVKTQLTVNETAPADLLVGNEPTPDTLTLVNEAILETLPEAKEQTSSIQPAVIAVVGAPTAETQSLVEETDLKTQDVNKLHEVKIPMNEMAAPDYQAAFHDSPSQSKVQSIKEVSQAQSIVSKSESNSDSSACKLPLNEGQSLCSEHNSVIQISSSNPPLSPDKQDFLHNIPLPDSPSNSLCLQHDEATSNKENMLHHKSLAYPSQIPHVDLPQLADLNTSPKHSTLAGQSSSHEQESLGVEYPFVTSDATFVAEQSSCVDQSKVAEHSDPHDDPLMTKPVEVNSHLKAQSFGSPQQTTLPTDHDTQQIFSETCPESKSPLNVEPCTSPDCVMLVEPYVSPEHSGLTSYTSPSSSHVALPWVNPTQSLLIESCAEHNKQPSLDESYTSPCRPVLVEPYVSPDHSLPSDPDDSSELTGLLKTGTLPEPSVELEVSLKPNENTNASLPVVHCDNTSQSLTDSYATLNNPSSSILPLLVEPYTSPIHPILVEPYVSPDHSPIIEQYTISPYDEVYTSCAKPYVDEFCAAPAQSPVVEPFAANSHSTAVECFPASVHAVEHLVKSDSNEVKNVSAELHNYNKQSSNCNYTESYVGLKPSQTPHTYAGSEPYGSTQCHPSSEQYDSSHQPLSTEPSTKPNYSVPFSSLLQKPTAIFSQPLQSETVTSEKPFPDHPNISREYPFSSQRTSTPPLSSTHCPISAKPYALVDSSTFVEAFVSPQHPHPAEPCASPALPLPAEPCASPALPLPAEPCASPALPLPAEPCASPALPLPAEPCASPALPLPAEPCASPALPLPAEPCASPLLTERPVFGDVDHCASPVQTLGESLTTVRPLAVDESCSSPVYSLLAAGPSASLLLPFSTESYTNTLLPEPCVVANSFLVAAEPLTSPDQTVVVVEPFIGIECPAGSSVSPDSFLQSSEPSESPVLPLLPADTCSGLDAKLLASEPCPRPDQMVLASEQSSSRAVLTSASHVITPSSYNDLHTNPLAEPFAITEQSLTEEPCVSPHLPFVEQPCNSPHVQNRHLVEESCPSPQCPSIEDPCVGTHQHIVKLLPFCPPHPTIEEMAPSHRHHHNIEEPFSSSDHSTVQESTGPSSRLLEEEPCVVPNIFIVKDPEIVTDHVVEKEPSVVPNCPIVIDPCVSSEYPIIEGATPNCPNVDNPPNSTNILEGPCASPYYSMVEEPCDKFKRPMEEEPTDCSDSPPLREPCIFPQSYPEDDLNTVNDKLLNKLYSSPKVTQFEPCALHEQSTSCYNSPLEEPVTSFSEPCSPVCSLTDKSCGSPDCLMPIEPCGSPDRHLQSEPCGSPYHLLPEEPCENPDCSLPENPYDSPKQSVAEHSSGTSDLPLIGQPLESPSISLRDGPSCNPQHLVSEESFSAQQSLSDKALFRMDTVLSDDTPFTASSLLSDDTPSGASSSLLDEAPSGVGSLPDEAPSGVGSSLPDETPSGAGSSLPDETPSGAGSSLLAEAPSGADSSLLAEAPSGAGSSLPAEAPSGVGSLLPDEAPSGVGSLLPDEAPSGVGSLLPDEAPSGVGSWLPDEAPSGVGSSLPDEAPSGVGSSLPDEAPSGVGSSLPDEAPSGVGSSLPGEAPSGVGSSLPGEAPSGVGSSLPGEAPSGVGSSLPGETPSGVGSSLPGETPSGVGSSLPGEAPSGVGSSLPGEAPSGVGSSLPEEAPSGVGSWLGDEAPSGVGSSLRDEAPSGVGSSLPDEAPSGVGSSLPDEAPSGVGSSLPEEAPSGVGSSLPDEAPLSLGTEEHRIKQPCSSTNNTLLTENSASIDNQLTTPHAEFPIPYDYQNNITALTPPEQCFRDPNPSQSYGGIDTCSELAAVNAPETLFSKPPSLPSLEAASENFSKTFALHPNDVPHADQNYKTPPPELLPYDSEQPKGLNSCASETSRDHVIFTSEPPPELLPYDSEQPENPYLCIPDCSSEQASSIFQAPPELLPYDSDQPALHHTQPHTPNVLTVGIQSSSFPQTEPEVPALHQSSASICTDSNKCQLENILLDDNSSIDSLNTLSTSTDGKLVSEREIKSNLQTSDKVSSQPIGEQVSISKLSQEESPLPSEKPNDCEPELGQPTELTLSVPIQPSISKISLQPPSSSPQQVVFDCSVSEKPMPENITQQPFISELPEQCPASCDLIAVPKQQSVSLPEPEEPSTTQLDSSKKQTPSKSIAKQESASSQSNSGTRRSRSKSVDQALAQSKSEDVKRSRSRSTTRVKRSRSKSLVRQRKSRSKSTSGRKRSRSITQRRKSRSKSLTRHSQSKSATQKKRSRSPSPNRKRRSNSVARRRRSRSPSVARRRRSRSASVTRRRRSRSKSTARRRRSRSPSGSRRRRSHSTSGSRRRRSNSISAARRKRSRSTSAARRKRSRSNSGVRRRRSRSASPARRKRSCSPLPAQKRSSRSPSPSRRRRSYSKSMTPKSPVHKSRARSKSDRSRSRSQSIATRKRKTQSRSPSREQSKQSEKRRKRSTSKDHYSTKSRRRSRTPPRRKKSRSPVRRTGLCMSPIRRRRSRSPLRRKSFSRSPIRRNRSRSREKSLDTSRSPKRLTDLDKAQLLEIAKANAAAMCAKAGVPLPPSLKPAMAPSATVEEKITHRTYGVTIQELTEKCKQIAQSKEDDVIVNKPHDSDEEEEERPFYNHPFKVSEHKPISFSLLNPSIKPAPKTQVTLTKEFPVSSGSQHRKKESDKVYGEWVPVDKKTEESKDDVFTSTGPSQPVDITSAMNERALAQTRLTGNPYDIEALFMLNRAQEQIDAWAQSTSLPGQFTGSTGAQVLTADEISNSGPQAWLKKDQFLKAAPVSGGRGALLMRKMGWREGEGLGRHNEGNVNPILIDFKTDRKGLVADGEKATNKLPLPAMKDLSGKHPISVLMELCNKKKWSPPEFVLVDDTGPEHRKRFLFRVTVNGSVHQPSQPSVNKKLAKATAAAAALQGLGALPKDSMTSTTNFRSASSSAP